MPIKIDFPPTVEHPEREMPEENGIGLASPRLAEIAQQQLHLLGEFTPTEAGSSVELTTASQVAMACDIGGLGAMLIANWLGEQVSEEQRATLRETSAFWLRQERANPLPLPGLGVGVSDVFSGIPTCLDLAVNVEQGRWFVNLLAREQLALQVQNDAEEARGVCEVVVFGHIGRAVRLGGLSQLLATVQDAGRMAAGIARVVDHGNQEGGRETHVIREGAAMNAVNDDFGFSGRAYTALSIVRWREPSDCVAEGVDGAAVR